MEHTEGKIKISTSFETLAFSKILKLSIFNLLSSFLLDGFSDLH